ncbi:Nucleolysin TIAR [Choanephora cucurbitarum]|nr:Nucleolysin TIAR [Choanephora cucurbitarum]
MEADRLYRNAHVMRDTMTGNPRGFGFVTYREKAEADQAIASMNGELLGSRNIRVNWATQKGQSDTPPPRPGQQLPYETVVQQTPSYVTSVYVGNLPPNVSDADLVQPFQRFGFIQEVKLQADKGFAFVKYDTHQNAANAIVHLQGININGREAKLSWGKDRAPSNYSFNNNGQQRYQNNNNWRQSRN